ncbi:MAG: DUF4377 domain-containing protein [Aggregatilineales bacterium]
MAQSDTDDTERIIHIAPYQQECTGVGLQQCLIVRFEDETDLTFFYDGIEGFTYEEGFEYTLKINVTERENVPADASSLQYELIEVLQQYPAHLHNKVWELQSLNGTDIEDPTRYTLLVTDEGVSIQADCNTVLANLTLNPFNIETTITTLVACPEDSLEMDFLAALNAASMMTVENGELILQSSEEQLRFAPPAIDGIEWSVTRVLGIAMMIELDGSVPYTLKINTDENEDDSDRVAMTIACNNGMGAVDIQGAVLKFAEIATTRAFCQDNPLADVYPPANVVYSINGEGNLILEDSAGTLYELSAIAPE